MVIERKRISFVHAFVTAVPQVEVSGGLNAEQSIIHGTQKTDLQVRLADAMKDAGMRRFRRHSTQVILTTEVPQPRRFFKRKPIYEEDGVSVYVRARKSVFHPIKWVTGDMPGHHEIRIRAEKQYENLLDMPPIHKPAEQIPNRLNELVNEQLHRGIFELAGTMKDRGTRHMLTLGDAGVAFGFYVNNALSSLDGHAVTSLALWGGKILDGSFSLPLLERSIPWIFLGYAIGTGVFMLYKIPHTMLRHKREQKYLAKQGDIQLAQVSFAN